MITFEWAYDYRLANNYVHPHDKRRMGKRKLMILRHLIEPQESNPPTLKTTYILLSNVWILISRLVRCQQKVENSEQEDLYEQKVSPQEKSNRRGL